MNQATFFELLMVKILKGTLINCDPAVKEIILLLDTKEHFVIEDLDANHLFVDSERLAWIKEQINQKLLENVYIPSLR